MHWQLHLQRKISVGNPKPGMAIYQSTVPGEGALGLGDLGGVLAGRQAPSQWIG